MCQTPITTDLPTEVLCLLPDLAGPILRAADLLVAALQALHLEQAQVLLLPAAG